MYEVFFETVDESIVLFKYPMRDTCMCICVCMHVCTYVLYVCMYVNGLIMRNHHRLLQLGLPDLTLSETGRKRIGSDLPCAHMESCGTHRGIHHR